MPRKIDNVNKTVKSTSRQLSSNPGRCDMCVFRLIVLSTVRSRRAEPVATITFCEANEKLFEWKSVQVTSLESI